MPPSHEEVAAQQQHPPAPRVLRDHDGKTCYDKDPFKTLYPFQKNVLSLVSPVGLGYPPRTDVEPGAVFDADDHVLFIEARRNFKGDFDLMAKFLGRKRWCLVGYDEFLHYVDTLEFVDMYSADLMHNGLSQQDVNAVVAHIFGLELDERCLNTLDALWEAMLEVEMSGAIIPRGFKIKIQEEKERQARRAVKAAAASNNDQERTHRKRSAQDAPANASKKSRGRAGQAPANKQSKFIGVMWHSGRGKWFAELMVKRRQVVPAVEAYHDEEEAAARAYDRAARRHLGEHALLNYASEQSSVFMDHKSQSGTWGGEDGATFSDYRGVYWRSDRACWNSKIGVNGKGIHLGNFQQPEEAAKAYDSAARLHHGDKAQVNFDEEGKRTAVKARVMNSGTKPRRAQPATSSATTPAPQSTTHAAPSSAVSAAAAAASHEEDEGEPAASMYDETAEEKDDDDWEVVV